MIFADVTNISVKSNNFASLTLLKTLTLKDTTPKQLCVISFSTQCLPDE